MTTAASESTERLCVAGERCKDFDHGRKHAAFLARESPPYCPDCLLGAERDVRNLPSDYAHLEQWLPKPLSVWSDGQPKMGRGELPLPLREFVLVLQRHIWWVLTAWEPIVRELDRLSDEPRVGVREGWAVQQAANVVAPRLRRLAEVGPTDMADYPPIDDSMESAVVWGPGREPSKDHDHLPILHVWPTGVEAIAHLTRLHFLANSMTGLTERIRHLPGFCYQCKEDDVLRQKHPKQFKHDPPVWCDQCGAWQPYDEYERMMKIVIWQEA